MSKFPVFTVKMNESDTVADGAVLYSAIGINVSSKSSGKSKYKQEPQLRRFAAKVLLTIAFLAAVVEIIASDPALREQVAEPHSPFEAQDQNIGLVDLPLFWSAWNGCGQAAVFVVCNHFGTNVPLTEVTSHIPVGENGTSMKSLVDGLTELGLKATGVQISSQALFDALNSNTNSRAIALVDNNHWVAVLNAKNASLDVFSYPNTSKVGIQEFADRYSGSAVIVSQPVSRSWFSDVSLAVGTSVASIGCGLTLIRMVKDKSF